MSEEIEVETKELQETIEELHEDRKERAEEEKKSSWTRYVALTTAILAVFAAIGALQSGSLVNEAMILQLKAADTWNEYQADKQKDHLYTTLAFSLLDTGARPSARSGPSAERRPATGVASPSSKAGDRQSSRKAAVEGGKPGSVAWKALSPNARLAQYIKEQAKEALKEVELQKEASELERESEEQMYRHHRFAASVALMQVAIALGAIASLTKMKSVWGISMVGGLVGLVFFVLGALAR